MTTHDRAWFSPKQVTAGERLVSNPFDSGPAARRYASGRPYYHRTALAMAFDRMGTSHVRLALDIGCGTGLSSRAVRERADRVIAMDMSLAMLGAASSSAGVCFLAAEAERIPLPDASVDLATVGAAFHWFDQPRAFSELARVLNAGAALVVYSDFFHGRLAGRSGFAEWLKNSYLAEFPTPARHAYFDPDAAEAAGFAAPSYDEDEILVPLTCVQLADYLLSQSNAAIAIESGRIGAAAMRDQIISETRVFFLDKKPTDVAFGVRVWTTVLHK